MMMNSVMVPEMPAAATNIAADRVDAELDAKLASLQAELARRLGPTEVVGKGLAFERAVDDALDKWIDRKEPLPFDVFAEQLDGRALFPRQRQAFAEPNMLRAEMLVSTHRTVKQWVLVWGKGCLAEDEELHDEASGVTRTVKEWAERGCSLLVRTFGKEGVRLAATSPVYKKGTAQLYRVTLADGRSFRATGFHRCLTPNGWELLQDLVPGKSRIQSLPPSANGRSSETLRDKRDTGTGGRYGESSGLKSRQAGAFPPALRPSFGIDEGAGAAGSWRFDSPAYPPVCASRSIRTLAGSPSGYQPSSGFGGVLPPPGAGIGQSPVLQSAGALGRSRTGSHKDGRLPLRARNRLYRSSFRRSEDTCRRVARGGAWACRAESAGAEPSPRQSRTSQRVRAWSSLPDNPRPSLRLSMESVGTSPFPFTQYTDITSIEPEGVGDFYDLKVPDTECYYDAQGVLHHNSGKDYLCAKFCAWCVYVLLHLRGDPAEFFGIAPGSRLSVINIAATEDQARNVFFEQYLKRFLKHPLIAPFIPAPRDQIQADKVIFYRSTATDEYVAPSAVDPTVYPAIGCFSMHSRGASIEGHNVIGFVMDEADAFLDKADKSNAEGVYNIMRSSASTRFAKNWFGLVISYPRVEEGFIMRLRERALKNMQSKPGRAQYYTDLAATWDVNLLVKRTDADIMEHYEQDPVSAAALYGCLPATVEHAFFDYPSRIDDAVDHTRSPVAIVRSEPITVTLQSGKEAHFMSAVVDSIRPVPGALYFLGGDAGTKGDAYAMAIWHTDESEEAWDWLCPACGRSPEWRTGGVYVHQPRGQRVPLTDDLACGVCSTTPQEYAGGWIGGNVSVADWWQRQETHVGSVRDARGREYKVRPLQEDLIVRIKPERATGNKGGSRDRPVYYPGIREVLRNLMVALPLQAARLDPHQTVEVTQTLMTETGGDIAEIGFSNPDQWRRARLAKSLLHAGLLSFLPNEIRDREWKRLVAINMNKIDHPPGGSKDLFDAASVAIWTAATYRNNLLQTGWI